VFNDYFKHVGFITTALLQFQLNSRATNVTIYRVKVFAFHKNIFTNRKNMGIF